MCLLRDTPKLTDAEIDEHCLAIPQWKLSEDRKMISRTFVARNFVSGSFWAAR